MRAGACGRLVECAEVAPVLRYVTAQQLKESSHTISLPAVKSSKLNGWDWVQNHLTKILNVQVTDIISRLSESLLAKQEEMIWLLQLQVSLWSQWGLCQCLPCNTHVHTWHLIIGTRSGQNEQIQVNGVSEDVLRHTGAVCVSSGYCNLTSGLVVSLGQWFTTHQWPFEVFQLQ